VTLDAICRIIRRHWVLEPAHELEAQRSEPSKDGIAIKDADRKAEG
jgi:hypothetical protein